MLVSKIYEAVKVDCGYGTTMIFLKISNVSNTKKPNRDDISERNSYECHSKKSECIHRYKYPFRTLGQVGRVVVLW